MEFGDLRPKLDIIITDLKRISRNTGGDCCAATTSAGLNINVPSGFKSVAIVQTGTDGDGVVDIMLSDGSIFEMSTLGETFVDVAPEGKFLPAYTITGSAFRWHAIK